MSEKTGVEKIERGYVAGMARSTRDPCATLPDLRYASARRSATSDKNAGFCDSILCHAAMASGNSPRWAWRSPRSIVALAQARYSASRLVDVFARRGDNPKRATPPAQARSNSARFP
jgi:hypothetical protein